MGASYTNEIWLYDVATGGTRKTLAGHRGAVRAIAFSAEEDCLVSAAADGFVRVWHIPEGWSAPLGFSI